MTETRAIAKIRYRIDTASQLVGNGADGKEFEDLEMAIQALEEIQEFRKQGITIEKALDMMCDLAGAENLIEQYRAIGTVEEFKALKEKADLYEQAFYLLLKDDCKRLPEGWTGSIDELYVGRKQFYLDKVEKTKVLGKIKT